MNYKEHRAKWNNCTKCSLCERRRHVVLYRGVIPADVLFIGEAPGTSEDDLGQPFVGPAGKLLDDIIRKALGTKQVKIGFTNLVSCIPIGEDGKKAVEPPLESIEACSDRFDEIYRLVRPKALICVGKLPYKHLQGYNDHMSHYTQIPHPAAILRAEKQNQGLLIQTCVVSIADFIEELGV